MSGTDDYKDRIKKATEKFLNKNLPSNKPKQIHTDQEGPVVIEIRKSLTEIGFDLTRIESKAVFSEKEGRYLSGQASPGTPDLVGNTPEGNGAYVEVKAKGQRSTLRPDQRDFLIRKIKAKCFAICADSPEYAIKMYDEWKKTEHKETLLLAALPKEPPRYKKMSETINWNDD